MDLLSAFKRKTPPPIVAVAPAAEAVDEVQRARTRARQRLIGAAVLVVTGIIGFPLLFETQPRPIPVDLPIEIPRKDGLPPLAMPAPTPPPALASGPAAAQPGAIAPATPSAARNPERVITETRAEAGREVAASAAATAASAVPKAMAPKPTGVPASQATSAAAAQVPFKVQEAEAARAQALLEGQPLGTAASDAVAAAPRFVVQVGAFAEEDAAREVRAKVEKLGLKTYTHVAQTPSGARTRVRVGPFATRADAERAALKLKSAGLPAAILSL